MRKEVIVVLLSLFSMIVVAQNDRARDLYLSVTMLENFKNGEINDDYLMKFLRNKKIKIDFDVYNSNSLNDKKHSLLSEIVINYKKSEYYNSALMQKAELEYYKGDLRNATSTYNQMIENYGENNVLHRDLFNAYIRIGEYYHMIGEYQKAISFFEKVYKFNLYQCDVHLSILCENLNFQLTEMMFYSYMSLNDIQKAFEVLLKPLLFQYCLGYDRYFEIVKFELRKKYFSNDLKIQWQEAINRFYSEIDDDEKGKIIFFLGVEIFVPVSEFNFFYKGCTECPSESIKGLSGFRFHQWIESL